MTWVHAHQTKQPSSWAPTMSSFPLPLALPHTRARTVPPYPSFAIQVTDSIIRCPRHRSLYVQAIVVHCPLSVHTSKLVLSGPAEVFKTPYFQHGTTHACIGLLRWLCGTSSVTVNVLFPPPVCMSSAFQSLQFQAGFKFIPWCRSSLKMLQTQATYFLLVGHVPNLKHDSSLKGSPSIKVTFAQVQTRGHLGRQPLFVNVPLRTRLAGPLHDHIPQYRPRTSLVQTIGQ